MIIDINDDFLTVVEKANQLLKQYNIFIELEDCGGCYKMDLHEIEELD